MTNGTLGLTSVMRKCIPQMGMSQVITNQVKVYEKLLIYS